MTWFGRDLLALWSFGYSCPTGLGIVGRCLERGKPFERRRVEVWQRPPKPLGPNGWRELGTMPVDTRMRFTLLAWNMQLCRIGSMNHTTCIISILFLSCEAKPRFLAFFLWLCLLNRTVFCDWIERRVAAGVDPFVCLIWYLLVLLNILRPYRTLAAVRPDNDDNNHEEWREVWPLMGHKCAIDGKNKGL